jgi:hypothetical protein
MRVTGTLVVNDGLIFFLGLPTLMSNFLKSVLPTMSGKTLKSGKTMSP